MGVAGWKARRKRRFRSVRRPVPSTFTQYWLCPIDSITVPDRSHLVGLRPFWFWTKTLSPVASGRSGRVCAVRLSVERAILVRMASSLAVQASRHSERMFGLEDFSKRLTKERASRSGWSNTICAGDTLQSGSGVLRSWSIAHKKPS